MDRPYDFAGNFRVDLVLDQDLPSDPRRAAPDRPGRLPVGGRQVKDYPLAVAFNTAAENRGASIRNLIAAVDDEGVVARRMRPVIPPPGSGSVVDTMVEITG